MTHAPHLTLLRRQATRVSTSAPTPVPTIPPTGVSLTTAPTALYTGVTFASVGSTYVPTATLPPARSSSSSLSPSNSSSSRGGVGNTGISMGVLIGIIVGSVILIALIVGGIVWYCVRKKRKQRAQLGLDGSNGSTDSHAALAPPLMKFGEGYGEKEKERWRRGGTEESETVDGLVALDSRGPTGAGEKEKEKKKDWEMKKAGVALSNRSELFQHREQPQQERGGPPEASIPLRLPPNSLSTTLKQQHEQEADAFPRSFPAPPLRRLSLTPDTVNLRRPHDSSLEWARHPALPTPPPATLITSKDNDIDELESVETPARTHSFITGAIPAREEQITPRRVVNPPSRRARPTTFKPNSEFDFNAFSTPPASSSASTITSPYPPSYQSEGSPPEAYNRHDSNSRVDSRPLNELEELLESWSWGPNGEKVMERNNSTTSGRTSGGGSVMSSPSISRSTRRISRIAAPSSSSPKATVVVPSDTHYSAMASTFRAQARGRNELQYIHEPTSVIIPIGQRLSGQFSPVAEPDDQGRAVMRGSGRVLSSYRNPASMRRHFTPPVTAVEVQPNMAENEVEDSGSGLGTDQMEREGHFTDSIYGLY